jgi:hypothetical protein
MKKAVLVVFVMAFLLPGLVFGQRTSTSISGTVTDPSGATIAYDQIAIRVYSKNAD